MRLLKDTQQLRDDPLCKEQLEALFDNVDQYTAEFDPFWEKMLPEAIKAHSHTGVGEYAGSGCVDYNEARGLYIFTRVVKPHVVYELGYAGGISSCFIAKGLIDNGQLTGAAFGKLYTVDLAPDEGQTCETFRNYCSHRTIIQFSRTDALHFLENVDGPPQLTFTDASHEYGLSSEIATILKTRWPNVVHLYHEWGMSNRSSEKERSYVSMQHGIGGQFERDAFEDVFGEEYGHGGLYGSCGLGIVMPL